MHVYRSSQATRSRDQVRVNKGTARSAKVSGRYARAVCCAQEGRAFDLIPFPFDSNTAEYVLAELTTGGNMSPLEEIHLGELDQAARESKIFQFKIGQPGRFAVFDPRPRHVDHKEGPCKAFSRYRGDGIEIYVKTSMTWVAANTQNG